ncbi:RES family NAD+ phosphorylase [Patescibacteria group bacterium]|nr:RES family NAD+ phosphorylase [Patescibacteria group bacterium]
MCGGRYNLKNTFEVLYMAPDLETAIAETKKPHNFKLPPKIIITIDVNVQEIVDLEDTQIVKTLDIDTGQLFGPWRVPINTESYTQTLGRLIYESKNFEGIRYPSAAPSVKNKYNLAIFPDRLKKGSEIRVYDPEKLVEQVILGKE